MFSNKTAIVGSTAYMYLLSIKVEFEVRPHLTQSRVATASFITLSNNLEELGVIRVHALRLQQQQQRRHHFKDKYSAVTSPQM